jgi:ferredoxin-NADP reductase
VAGAALLSRPAASAWLLAEVSEVVDETPSARTLVLSVPGWPGHRAGQHLDVRLTAEDGYQASRSYSLASPPGEPPAITVELIEDGEVSPYLAREVATGDRFEVRGPIGGYFVWEPADGGPLLLLAGGSGIVPLRAIARHRAASPAPVPARLVYSSRSLDQVIYRAELERLAGANGGLEVVYTLTRSQPPGWTGHSRRIDADLLRETAFPAAERPLAYVCGPTSLVETAASALVELGYEPGRVKTERFGPTGGR